VPVTTFAPIATGGVAQQPVTSFNYRNIGVNIDITPRIHHDDDVTLALKVEISSLSSTGYGGLPTFGNRSINTEIRLRDGETNMLAGLIRDDEREIKEGIPGLSDLPVVGQIFGRTHKEATETDIILTLTPHIVRVLDLHEADLAPFRLERAGSVPTALDVPGNGPSLPLPVQVPQPDEVINDVAGSPVLRILNEALRATQISSRSDYPVSYRRRVADEHQDIIDALRTGNATLACDRMRTHVHTSAHSWAGARPRGQRHANGRLPR